MDPTVKAILLMFLGALIGSGVAFFFARLGKRSDNRTAAEIREAEEAKEAVEEARKATVEREKRLVQLESEMAVLKAQAVPINAAFLAMSIAKLTHLHTPRLDELMKKVGPPSVLTPAEESELAEGLAARMKDMSSEIDDEERIRAEILPSLIKLEKIEALKNTESPTLETMLISQPIAEIPVEKEKTK